MAVTVGPIGSAPTPTVNTVGDKRIDLTTGTVWRNADGKNWSADARIGDDVLAALLAASGSLTNQARGVVVIPVTDTTPPAGTPAGTVVYKRTT